MPRRSKRTAEVASLDEPARSVESPGSSDADYDQKRRLNNIAVQKSRQKKRNREQDTAEQVEQLRAENAKLEKKAEVLQAELDMLKSMFVQAARGSGEGAALQPDSSTTQAEKRTEDRHRQKRG